MHMYVCIVCTYDEYKNVDSGICKFLEIFLNDEFLNDDFYKMRILRFKLSEKTIPDNTLSDGATES